MSGSTFGLAVGQVFTGAATVPSGDEGSIAFTQTGSVSFNTSVPPGIINSVTITKDEIGSTPQPVSITTATLQTMTITAVTPNTLVVLNSSDIPPGQTIPAGFTLPQTVEATTFAASVTVSVAGLGTVVGTITQAGVIATDGSLLLTGAVTLTATVPGFGTQTVNFAGGILSVGGGQPTGSGLSETFLPAYTVACFGPGTRLSGEFGDVKIEDLRPGDRLFTQGGATRPITWIGHRRVDCRRHTKPAEVMPVRISAGAFGPGMPARELILSPDHSVYSAEHDALIPVKLLVNGTSIVQLDVGEITYWHVELDAHDVVLAEGLPAESYLDTGNRNAFEGEVTLLAHPDFSGQAREARGCAPLVVAGPVLEAVRESLRGYERAARFAA